MAIKVNEASTMKINLFFSVKRSPILKEISYHIFHFEESFWGDFNETKRTNDSTNYYKRFDLRVPIKWIFRVNIPLPIRSLFSKIITSSRISINNLHNYTGQIDLIDRGGRINHLEESNFSSSSREFFVVCYFANLISSHPVYIETGRTSSNLRGIKTRIFPRS